MPTETTPAEQPAPCPPWCTRPSRCLVSHSAYFCTTPDQPRVSVYQRADQPPTISVLAPYGFGSRVEDLTFTQANALAYILGHAGATELSGLLHKAVEALLAETEGAA